MCFSLRAMPADAPPKDSAWSRALNVANPYASIGYAYDSNLFRLDNNVAAPAGRSDRYLIAAAGFESDIHVSQQRYELSGELSRNLFDNYDELDYTGARATSIWHWSAGEALYGSLGYKYRRSLRDFANQLRPDKVKDLRTESRFLGSADIDLPSNWKLGVRTDLANVGYSETQALDLERTTSGAALSYVTSAGSAVGLDAEFIKGDYDTNPAADFDEYTVGPTVEWQVTARSFLDARVGYTSRDTAGPDGADYDDITGRISYTLTDADRSKLKATVWRDLSNLSDEIAEFAVVNGASLEPSWKLPNGLDLSLRASYENRDFPVEAALSGREDDVYSASATIEWPLGRNVSLAIDFEMERRSSTRKLQDYDYANVELRVIGRL